VIAPEVDLYWLPVCMLAGMEGRIETICDWMDILGIVYV